MFFDYCCCFEKLFLKAILTKEKGLSVFKYLGGGDTHFLNNIDTFLNIYCDEITSLNEDHCCNVLFPSSFCNLGDIYCSTNFTFSKFFKKYCKIEVKNLVCVFKYFGFSVNYLDSNLQFKFGF